MSKKTLKTFTALNKEVKVKIKDQVIQLKEKRKFMSRLILFSRKREGIDFPYILYQLIFVVV